MKVIISTIKSILRVAWIGLTTDYQAKESKNKYEECYEKQKVVYKAKPLMGNKE